MIQILMTMAFVFVMMTLMSNMMMKKQQKKYVEKMEEYSQQYAHLDEKTFDELDDNELKNAVVARIWKRRQENEDVIPLLTEGEKIVYTVYLVENTIQGGRGSLYNFFVNERSKPLIDHLVPAYQALECPEIADIMEQAIALNEKYIQEEETGEAMEYQEGDLTFDDFSKQLFDVMQRGELADKMSHYIRLQKQEFIDRGEEDEKDISE